MLPDDCIKILRRLKDDFKYFSEKCLKIVTKNGELIPFVLNKAQNYALDIILDQFVKTGRIRVICLKGRQIGFTTLVEGFIYWTCIYNNGFWAFILTHNRDATNHIFEIAKNFHAHCPTFIKPITIKDNAKVLNFEGIGSGYKVGTAGNKEVGRSGTIQCFHGSEVAFWKNPGNLVKGVLQSVPSGALSKGTIIIFESTANGTGNFFHEQWQLAEASESEFIPIFIPWFWQEEYSYSVDEYFKILEDEVELVEFYNLSNEQLKWRRCKIKELSCNGTDGTKAFMQEYPCNSFEAFQVTGEDNFIDSSISMRARKSIDVIPDGPLIIGVDPATTGPCYTSIIRRRRRVAFGLEIYPKTPGMEVVGIIHCIILEEKPMKVVIDAGGIGAIIIDRLIELGHKNVIISFNGGGTALNAKTYFNRRAEVWGMMNLWLLEEPCKIPDDDALYSELCGLKLDGNDSLGRIKLESKKSMINRGVKSPDRADSLSLTFACPESSLSDTIYNQYSEVAKNLSSHSRHIDRLRQKAHRR